MIRSVLILLILSLPFFTIAKENTDTTHERSHLNYQTSSDIRHDVIARRVIAIPLIVAGSSTTLATIPFFFFATQSSQYGKETALITAIPFTIGAGMVTGGFFILKRANKIARGELSSLQIQPEFNPLARSTGIKLTGTF